MSWQAYIDQLLTKVTPDGTMTNCVEHAAVVSAADGSIWASTPNFGLYGYQIEVPTESGEGTQSVDINEIELFLYVVRNNGSSNSKAGIRICNEKYFMVNSDPALGTIYLKKNGGGACIVKNEQCILFTSWNGSLMTEGVHPGAQVPGLCNEQCEKVALFLKNAGY